MDQVASSLPARQAWCPTLICHRRPGFHLSLWGGLGQLAWASLADPGVPPRRLSGSVEIKLGKNRTEAEVKRYTEEKERLEKKKEEIRGHLAQLRKEKRELKETLLKCTGNGVPRRGAWALSGGGAESRSAHLVHSPVSLWHRWMLPAESSPPSCLKGCCPAPGHAGKAGSRRNS